MRISTLSLLLELQAWHALGYTQNASIAITGALSAAVTTIQEAVVQVPIVNTSIVPVTCTSMPFGVKNATLLPIVTPHNSSYTCAFLAGPCRYDFGEVTPEQPSKTFQYTSWAANCWWPFDPHTGLSYPLD